MKIAFSTLGCYERNIDEIIDLAIRYGISGIEVRGIDNVMDNSEIVSFKDNEHLSTLNKIKNSNLEFTVLGTSCKFHDKASCDKYLPKSLEEIDIAYKMGFKAIRIFGNNILDDNSIDCLINSINEICAYNRNVDILLETHGDFNTIESLSKVINGVSSNANFGLIWDIYHTYRVYGNQFEDFYNTFKPFIRHVHIKDSLNNHPVPFGKGEIDYMSVILRLAKDRYPHYISIEWEKKWFDDLEELEIVLESLDIDQIKKL